MYLDKIEIHGFKSFGDAVKLNIPRGIQLLLVLTEVGKVMLQMPFAGYWVNKVPKHYAEPKWKILYLLGQRNVNL